MSLFSVTPQGIITVDTADILDEFQNAYKTALQAPDLELETSTPQGQLIALDTKMLQYAQEQAVLASNALNPITAKGGALDSAAAIWGYYRKDNIPSVVTVNLTGQANTTIPAGTLFSDNKNNWSLLDNVVLNNTGIGVGQAQCTTEGSISCGANTLNSIVTPVVGLETVNNPTAAILGTLMESDNTFRQRITANWFNIRGRSILGAIIDNIAQLSGVVSVVGRENYSDTPKLIDGVSMVAHSIYLDVLGGDGAEIAKVIAEQKTLGAAVNGSTTVNYYDNIAQYNYEYKIDRPTPVNVYVKIEYKKNLYTPADVEQQIKNTVVSHVAENPFMIADTVSGGELAQAFSDFGFAEILSVKVSTNGTEYQDYITTNIQQVPVIDINNITAEEVQQ